MTARKINESIHLRVAEEKQAEVGHLEDAIVQNQQLQWDLNPKPRLCCSDTPIVVSTLLQPFEDLILRPNTRSQPKT